MDWYDIDMGSFDILPISIIKISAGGCAMLGINDPWILSVYLLCILSTVLCVGYGLINWNKGWESEREEINEEMTWEEKEEEMQEKELGL